jgi:3-methyl-2-oxobutanoate hydroxymethyltransferase
VTPRTVRGEDALPSLAALRRRAAPIVMITAYDFPGGRIAELAGADVVLVGDSAANTVLGYATTREIGMEELLMLTRAVRRAVRAIPVVGDLPFGSYEGSDELAVASARRFVEEAGCDAVKLEGAGEMLPRVRAIIAAGIPVVGHVGLLPQSVTSPDGYRARGREAEQALAIIADASALEEAGCAVVVVEAVPSEIGALIAERLTVPVIGIGAGSATDGQVLVYHDLLGYGEGRQAKFVRRYAAAHELFVDAVQRWAADVRSREFPSTDEGYGIDPAALDEIRTSLKLPRPS